MTPYEFGCRVKIAVETGGFGEYLGQGFDRGIKTMGSAISSWLPTPSPGYAAGGMGGMASTGAGAAQRMQMPPARVPPGPSDSTVDPALLAPQPRPQPAPRAPAAPPRRVPPGLSDATVDPSLLTPEPAPRPAVRPANRVPPGPSDATPSNPTTPPPRPAAVRPAPAQPKPTAPGVRKPPGRIA